MNERLDRLERRLEDVVSTLAAFEARLRRLESSNEHDLAPAGPGPAGVDGADDAEISGIELPGLMAMSGALPILGRAFLVLCGAFLLRGLTDAGILPQTVGVALGFLYAVLWVALANRAAAAGRTLAATLSGGVASIVAFPLLWEATRRFELLSPDQASIGLAVFSAFALAVAWRRGLGRLATFVTLAALVTDLSLVLGFKSWGVAAVVALALAAYSIWCGYLRGWTWVRWPAAFMIDLLPVAMISDAVRGLEPGIPAGPDTVSVLLVSAGFVAVYLGSFALATLRLQRRVGVFEIVQGVVVLAAGFAATHHYLNALQLDDRMFGAVTLLAGLVCYATAFVFVDRRFGRGVNFFYFSSLALVLSVGGVSTASEGVVRVAMLGVFGAGAAVLGTRFDRITLRSHAALFVAAALVAGGTAARIVATYAFAPAGVTRPPAAVDLLAVGAAVICFLAFSFAATRSARPWPTEIPDLVIAAISVVGVGSVGLAVFTGLVDRAGPVDPSLMAAARTVVLALLAVAAAWLGSLRGDRALQWLVYPLLVVCGLKLVIEDLRHGRPAMLFVAFAVFGIALILAPRLLRSAGAATDQ